MEQALELVAGVETQRPGIAQTLRAKMGIEERIPEFVEEALRARQTSAGLTNVLKLMPESTMEQLASRFNRCSLRDDAEHISNLAADLGEEALQYLRTTVRGGPVPEAAEMVGLLSKLDPQAVEVFLPGRVKNFPRIRRTVLCASFPPVARRAGGRILLKLLDHVDPHGDAVGDRRNWRDRRPRSAWAFDEYCGRRLAARGGPVLARAGRRSARPHSRAGICGRT